MERPSVYLAEKADNLGRTLDFFSATEKGRTVNAHEKRLVFLAQIDFWEWEIDNLIYSFDTFQQRARLWNETSTMKDALAHHGIAVQARIVQSVKWSRTFGRYSIKGRKETVEPYEVLNEVIGKWNGLLDLLEGYLAGDLENSIKLGAQLLPDLSKFRKTKLNS